MEKEKKDFIKNWILGTIPVSFFWSIAMACSKPEAFFQFQVFDLQRFLQYLVVAIPVFAVGGFFQGLWMCKKGIYKK